jgi:F0F1-type ATP synthase delta subunit
LVRDLAQYRADNDNIVEVETVSAHPIDAAAKTLVQSRIKAVYPAVKRIIITERHDPNVLGGVRLELANQQLDLTARGKLNRFKQLTTVGEN